LSENEKVFGGEYVDIWHENNDGKSALVLCVGKIHLYLNETEFEELSHGINQILHQTNEPRGDFYK
jgi:hypothetical protein|tara:strand:+ start:207 stop:404 length:198 start_codon:yes stop_codon:yes gene_type:complete